MTYTVTQDDKTAAERFNCDLRCNMTGTQVNNLAGLLARHRIETLERAAEVAKRNHDYETEDAIRNLKGKSDE